VLFVLVTAMQGTIADESTLGEESKFSIRSPTVITKFDAFASQDFKTIQMIAHRLRGAAANLGWTELAEATAKLEAYPSSFDTRTLKGI